MYKRKKVPPKRKRELEDHVTLVRSVRARHMLDLSRELVHRQLRPGEQDGGAPSDAPSAVSVHPKKVTKTELVHWTKWPLLLGDVYVPEWSLMDEVETMVERFVKADAEALDRDELDPTREPQLPDVEDAASDEEDAMELDDNDKESSEADRNRGKDQTPTELLEEVELESSSLSSDDFHSLSPSELHNLTESTHDLLDTLLRALAISRPTSEPARLRSIDWADVLEVASAYGLADAETIRHVQHIMEDLHGPATLKSLDRRETLRKLEKDVDDFVEAYGDVDDDRPGLPFIPPTVKKKKRTRRTDQSSSDESNSDDSEEKLPPVRSREFISDSDTDAETVESLLYKLSGPRILAQIEEEEVHEEQSQRKNGHKKLLQDALCNR
ncbi:hypothetical protein BKA62DRAFT_769687 [Auriculariales sp. MPI-PUGE-AT-0066]|nr:hypothetical protein BKA62DRAFT_769687 [Auriculariales sp. MPI-PUGE-AT-0066]